MSDPTLSFLHGTLAAARLPRAYAHPAWKRDARADIWRAPAQAYSAIVAHWRSLRLPFTDAAASFTPLAATPCRFAPHPHQAEALAAWRAAGDRGVVVLPTGAGKTLVAVLAMQHLATSTLVVVPTIDLLQQWHRVLHEHLQCPVGMLGGGEHTALPVTVATYDSASMHIERLGRQFGLLVCDECHHLPASSYQFIAAGAVAPARLGLTATPERADGRHDACNALLGPICYRVEAAALGGRYLAPYEVRRVDVAMTPDEHDAFVGEREVYTSFLRRERILLGGRFGWTRFVVRAAKDADGRRAMRAYRAQRRLALACSGKTAALWEILWRHRHDRCIVFTDDNATVYDLSRLLHIPAITHHTGAKERQAILRALAENRIGAVVTSRVLNEGVDVPEVSVGVVLSGSSSVREHVQRLGRLLRKRPDKRALLYEICSLTSAEQGMSRRRRQHAAYHAHP